MTVSENGYLSWEEVECLGACVNAPAVQIGKDYYEDLDQNSFEDLIEKFEQGGLPIPGSKEGRFSSEATSKTKKLIKGRVSQENSSLERFRG